MVNRTKQVFLFIGDDSYLKDKATSELKGHLFDSSSAELNYKVFDGRQAEAKEILDYLATIPFLASMRLAVIKDFEKLPADSRARLVDYIKKPSKSVCLVLETKDGSIVEKDPELARHVNIKRFDELSGSSVLSFIKESLALKDKFKKMSMDAAKYLRELKGQDTSSLVQELDKLVSFTAGREEITLEDVEEIVGKSVIVSAFDLTRAIEKNKVSEALNIVSDLILSGKKHYEIMGLLVWHFKRLLRAKVLLAKGETKARIAGILKIGWSYSEEFFRQVEDIEMHRVRAKMKVLLDADLDLKRTRFDPNLVLEFVIIRLCLG